MVSVFAALALICAAAPAMATVTITDCASDPRCVIKNKRTSIDVPNDTVVLAGAIVPKTGTDMVRVRAGAIVVDGSAGGSITADGKGKAIELNATGSVVVTGDLLSSDPNGTINITAVQMIKIEGPVDVESGGDIDIQCTGDNCPIVLVNAHFKANRFLVDADGNIIWDGNFTELFGPRDLFKMKARNGAVEKASAMLSVLAAGHLLRLEGSRGVDAVSEAQAFCQSCQIFSPSPTPAGTASASPTPTKTATPTSVLTATPTPPGETPTPPFETASAPIGTPSPTVPESTATQPQELPTPTPTATTVLTATLTATPTASAPTPNVTPSPGKCNEVIGGVESTLFITAAGDLDLACTEIRVSENVTLKAGGNIDLTDATIDNTTGKCGEIVITAGGQINIQGATIIDDDCPNPGDVSEMNGREQVPHTGFANVVGTPLVDD